MSDLESRFSRLEQRVDALASMIRELVSGGTPLQAPLRITDDAGQPITTIEASEAGAVLVLHDQHGRPGIRIGGSEAGDGHGIWIAGEGETPSITLSKSSEGTALSLVEAGASPSAARLAIGRRGASCSLEAPAGGATVELEAVEDRASVVFCSRRGRMVTRLYTQDESSMLEVWHRGECRMVSLGDSPDGKTALTVFDGDGRVLFSQTIGAEKADEALAG